MLNLNPNDAVTYTIKQQQAIDDLITNMGSRSGKELWDDEGVGGIFNDIKDRIREHCLDIQQIRCAFCETGLVYGGVHIEHFAKKSKYRKFLYEPLNLVCSCPICNGFALKGTRDTIKDAVRPNYRDNTFLYVHPFLDNVDREIKYKDIFKIFVDREHSTDKGKKTIDLFHWDTFHARKKRFSNLFFWSTSKSRRKMISEILNFKE